MDDAEYSAAAMVMRQTIESAKQAGHGKALAGVINRHSKEAIQAGDMGSVFDGDHQTRMRYVRSITKAVQEMTRK